MESDLDGNPLPLEVEKRIDAMCDDAEARLQRGERPSLDDYLRHAPSEAHSALLKELAQLFLEYTASAGTASNETRKDEDSKPTSAVDEVSPEILERLGDFQLLEQIGSGGMGVVYRARDLTLNRIVAVKLLPTERFAHTPETRRKLLARFRREATTTAQLQHPNIVAIFEVGDAKCGPYYSMQYVEGVTLARRIADASLVAEEVARYLLSVSRAIQALHDVAIYHRDIKPSNILIDSRTDQALVADFGLAKLVSDQDFVTRSGEFFGTPAYMAPEQILDSAGATAAADIYSIGATMYHSLTGRAPFVDTSTPGLLHQVLDREPIAPSVLNPSVPRDLESVCLKCLEKEPKSRYAAAKELGDDLERYLTGRPVSARPIRWSNRAVRWCRRNPLSATSLTIVLLTLILASIVSTALYLDARLAAKSERVAMSDLKRQLAQQCRLNARFADGPAHGLPFLVEALRLSSDDPDVATFDRIRIGDALNKVGEVKYLGFHDKGITSIAFDSTDRRLLSASDDGSARSWTIQGTSQAIIYYHGAPVTHATFAMDGQVVATAGFDGALKLWNADSGLLRREFKCDKLIHRLAVDSTSHRIAAASHDNTVRIYCLETMECEKTIVFPDACIDCSFGKGGCLLVRCANGHAYAWSPETTSTPRELSTDAIVTAICLTPDGEHALLGDANGGISIWDLTRCTKNRVFAFAHSRPVSALAINGDGSVIASVADDNTVRMWSLSDGSQLATLDHPRPVTALRFSSDGRSIGTACKSYDAYAWSVETGKCILGPLPHAGNSIALGFCDSDQKLISAGSDCAIRMWEVRTNSALSSQIVSAVPTVCDISRDHQHIMIADQQGMVHVLDSLATPLAKVQLRSQVTCARFSFDADRVLVGLLNGDVVEVSVAANRVVRTISTDNRIGAIEPLADNKLTVISGTTVKVYEASSTVPQLELELEGSRGTLLTTVNQGKTLLIGAGSRLIWLDVPSANAAPTGELPTIGTVTALASDAQTNQVAIGESSGRCSIWRAGAPLRPIRNGRQGVAKLAFGADDSAVAIAYEDGSVEVCRVDAPGPLIALNTNAAVLDVTFATHSMCALTADVNGELILWDAGSGEPICVEHTDSSKPHTVFSLDNGRKCVVVGHAGNLDVWRVPLCDQPYQGLLTQGELISSRQYSAAEGLVPLSPRKLRERLQLIGNHHPQ